MSLGGMKAVIMLTGLLLVSMVPAPALAVDSSYLDLYPSYDEVTDEIFLMADEHPDIVMVVSIGVTIEGRDIWAVEVSDNVDDDGDWRLTEVWSLPKARKNGLQDRLRGR